MSLESSILGMHHVSSHDQERQADVQRDMLPEAIADVPPSHAVNIALRWNESKATILKLSATLWCAFVMGANDAAYGAIIPYVSTTRSRYCSWVSSDIAVSLSFTIVRATQ